MKHMTPSTNAFSIPAQSVFSSRPATLSVKAPNPFTGPRRRTKTGRAITLGSPPDPTKRVLTSAKKRQAQDDRGPNL